MSVEDTFVGCNFLMKIDGVAKKVANWINKNKGVQKAIKGMSENPALAGAAASFVISTTARPGLILAVTPDKDDAKFGAASSVSAAITEVIGSYAIYKPMNKRIEESSRQLFDKEGSIFFKNAKLLRSYKSITNRMAKLPFALLISIFRFSLVYPMTKLLGRMGIVKSTERGEDKPQKLDVKA